MYYFVYAVILLVGLIQIPILVDISRAIFPRWKLRRTTHWCINILLVSVMSSFFVVGLSYYLLIFLPLAVEHPFSSLRGLLHITFAFWVWTNIVVNYFMAVFVHPGKAVNFSVTENPPNILTNGMDWNPPRYHYCIVCQESVLYMDHHCPFTGNCAGLKNYSYFLLCLVYGSVGLGYALWMSYSYFNQCVLVKVWWMVGLAELNQPNVCKIIGPHANIFLAVLGGFYVTFNMTILQLMLLFADLSSHDILKNISKLSVFRFAWHRMKGGKYKNQESRLNVMFLQQRSSLLWFLIPCMNTCDEIPLSVITKE